MSSDLVKRLRSANDESFVETLCGEAADRIEQLTADKRFILEERDRTFALMLARAEKAEAEVLALREVIGAVNNEFGSAAWNWPDPWRRVAQLKELSNDRWKRAEAAEAERDRLREALVELVQQTHNCERELTEDLHHVDFCGESVPLTNARAALKGESHD